MQLQTLGLVYIKVRLIYLQGFSKLSQTEYVIEDMDSEPVKGKRKQKGARREFKV